MSGLQALLIGCGAIVGLGAFLLLRAVLVVEQPELADALARLDGRVAAAPVGPARGAGDRWAGAAGAAGTWAAARLPAPVLPAPTPNAATLGPIASAGRGTVNASAVHGVPGVRCGNTIRSVSLCAI